MSKPSPEKPYPLKCKFCQANYTVSTPEEGGCGENFNCGTVLFIKQEGHFRWDRSLECHKRESRHLKASFGTCVQIFEQLIEAEDAFKNADKNSLAELRGKYIPIQNRAMKHARLLVEEYKRISGD